MDRRVKLGQISLAPGYYSTVLLPRQDNLGELYFFAGKSIENWSMRGVAIVEMVPAEKGESAVNAGIDYTNQLPVQINAIHAPGQLLRFVNSD